VFAWLKERRRKRLLDDWAIPDAQWQAALHELPFLDHYDAAALARLRELSTLFLVEKNIVSGADDGPHALDVTPLMRIIIAAQACLLILGRDESVTEALHDYGGFDNVVVHPDDFPSTQDYEDEAGVVHTSDEMVLGESLPQGPVLLSWPAVEAGYEDSGMALVIHEFAHKIDLLDGEVDGIPPLHGEARRTFAHAIGAAFDDFRHRVEGDEDTAIDPYAAEDIGEFFAVSCEVFFAEPELLREEYPDYFGELRRYFCIDPVAGRILG